MTARPAVPDVAPDSPPPVPSAEATHIFVFLQIFSCEGGIQSYVRDVLNAYDTAAHATKSRALVLLLRDGADCPNPYDRRQNPNGSEVFEFRYFQSSSPWLGRVRLAWALLRELLQHRPSAVICGHVKLAPLVELLCRPLSVPYVVMTYGKEVWATLGSSYRKALSRARSLWTISRYSRDRACESNDLDPATFQMLPCVVDGDRFFPAPKPEFLLDRYQLRNARVLMTVARLWSGDIYKGVDVTIRALPKILQACPDVNYLVVGRGDDRPRLEQLARDLEVSDRVVFAGFVPTEELPDLYRVADAYIMPSQEGFGIVYLEAMATGIPVLSGDSDGSADPLRDGKLGWQVPHRDPDAVALACIEILKGDDRRTDGDWLRRETLATFGDRALANRLQELLVL